MHNWQCPTVYSTGNSVQCYVAVWIAGEFGGRTDTCICIAESLCCLAEAIICINISYTPIQNKKLKKMLSTPNLPYSALLLSPITLTTLKCTIQFTYVLRLLYVGPLESKGNNLCLFCSLINPKHLELCLIHCRCLINTSEYLNYLFHSKRSAMTVHLEWGACVCVCILLV